MKYYFDTEFIEGFRKPLFGRKTHFIELISIGIVCEDGRTYSAISKEYNYKEANSWVREHVIAPLYQETVPNVEAEIFSVRDFHKHFGKSLHTIAEEIVDFVSGGVIVLPAETHEFYAYYADYDWVLLCSLFGRMVDLPKGFPMYCKDLKQTIDDNKWITKVWVGANVSKNEKEHDALADAMWVKNFCEAIQLSQQNRVTFFKNKNKQKTDGKPKGSV